jgi:hypothetical protein
VWLQDWKWSDLPVSDGKGLVLSACSTFLIIINPKTFILLSFSLSIMFDTCIPIHSTQAYPNFDLSSSLVTLLPTALK